ncbi:MAG: hypothetical protein KatS3mg104_3050 [Phycisphaerae bacterium]|nr:MAG: hypothetical protein KatS3mg104_3050 [Phycisphaerae bacterium]
MTAQNAFASPEKWNDIEFPLLTMRQYGMLESAVSEHIRKKTKAALVAEKIPEDRQIGYILDVAQRLVSLADVDAFIRTSSGAGTVLRLSLKQAGKSEQEAEEIVERIPVWEAIRLALKVSTLEAMFRAFSAKAEMAKSDEGGVGESEQKAS